MYHLQVEELEPRQLLNGTYFSSGPPFSEASAAGTFVAWVTERSAFVEFDVRLPGGEVEFGLSWSIAPHGFEGWGSPGLRAPAGTNPGAPRPATGGIGLLRVGGGYLGPGSDAAEGPELLRTTTSATLFVPPEVADSGRGAIAASAESGPGVSPAPPRLPNRFPVSGFGALVAGPSPGGATVLAAREGQGLFFGPDQLALPQSHLAFPGLAAPDPAPAPDREPAGEGPVLPAPQVAGVLAALPAFELSALERGMQHFLEQLEGVGQGLGGHGDGLGLWIAAGAAAAVACEMARRQWRRASGGAGPEVHRLPEPPPGPLFAG
jgi:hypothetical protein